MPRRGCRHIIQTQRDWLFQGRVDMHRSLQPRQMARDASGLLQELRLKLEPAFLRVFKKLQAEDEQETFLEPAAKILKTVDESVSKQYLAQVAQPMDLETIKQRISGAQKKTAYAHTWAGWEVRLLLPLLQASVPPSSSLAVVAVTAHLQGSGRFCTTAVTVLQHAG